MESCEESIVSTLRAHRYTQISMCLELVGWVEQRETHHIIAQ